MISNSKRNIELYKIYRVFGYDYLFYTVISFIFLTQTKSITVAQVMFLSGFSAIFNAIFQIPSNYFVEKVGLKKAMVIGNFLWVLSCSILIFANNFTIFILSEACCSLGTCLKGLTETQMLYASLKESNQRSKMGKIEGKAVAGFYYVEAISALTVGILYEYNNYIPIAITLTGLIISFVTSLFFVDVQEKVIKDDKNHQAHLKEYLKGFKLVLKSNRIISIFIYSFLISGVIAMTSTLQKSIVVDLGVPVVPYTFIFAAITLAVGIGSRIQYQVEKITKRKTLTVVGYILTIGIVMVGVINKIFQNSLPLIIASVAILLILNVAHGIYRISVKKYMNNFTTANIRGKILSVFYIFENIGKSLLTFVCGMILDNEGTSLTCIIMGVFASVVLYFILKFMDSRLGRDPQEYEKKDIFGMEIN